jgi:LysM repeat protein
MEINDHDRAKFFSKVQVTDKCHHWVGSIKEGGYGQFRLGGRKGKLVQAHRFAYANAFGEIPKGLCVCHKCDVRNCVNPEHLFVGTSHDNTIDCILKGRRARKLTKEIVEKIRAEKGMTAYFIAKKYGVDVGLVSRIVRMKSWKIMPLF